MVSLGEIAFWSLEGGDILSCPEGNDVFGTHDTCQNSMACFTASSPLIPFVSSHEHPRGKRSQLKPELLSHTLLPGSVISDPRQMEVEFLFFFPFTVLISQVQTLSLLHVNH